MKILNLTRSRSPDKRRLGQEEHKGKNCYLLFYLFKFLFLVVSVSLCDYLLLNKIHLIIHDL